MDAESDADVRFELEPGVAIGYVALVGLREELTALIGRRADLRCPGELSRYVRERVLDEAEELCVSG